MSLFFNWIKLLLNFLHSFLNQNFQIICFVNTTCVQSDSDQVVLTFQIRIKCLCMSYTSKESKKKKKKLIAIDLEQCPIRKNCANNKNVSNICFSLHRMLLNIH